MKLLGSRRKYINPGTDFDTTPNVLHLVIVRLFTLVSDALPLLHLLHLLHRRLLLLQRRVSAVINAVPPSVVIWG